MNLLNKKRESVKARTIMVYMLHKHTKIIIICTLYTT